MLITKNCKTCNKEFTSYSYRNREYCSNECSGKARRNRVTSNCQMCNKEFTAKLSDNKKYCSNECRHKSLIGQNKVEREIRKCLYCESTFEVTPSDVKTYCSNACVAFHRSVKAGYNANYEKQCKWCNEIFLLKKPSVPIEYCSQDCHCESIKSINKSKRKLLPEIKLYSKNHNIKEIAEHFDINYWLLKKWGIFALQRKKIYPDSLTPYQEEIIIGNLLGDGCISCPLNLNRNTNFSINQKRGREKYIDFLFDVYSPFSCNVSSGKSRKPKRINGKINHDIENWNGEYCYYSSLSTIRHPVFTELRKKWYKEPYTKRSPKIVPLDIRLTWKNVAIWMIDDGCNNINYKKIDLYTNGFTVQEAEFLVERLKKDLEVFSRIRLNKKTQPIISISKEDRIKFIEGIREFIPWNYFQYKCII